MKWMAQLMICKKLISIGLNNSSVEVRVVDSNHDSCIEFFTIAAEGYFLQPKDAQSGQHSSFVAEWSKFTLNSLQWCQLPLCEPSDHNDCGKLKTSCLHSYSFVIMLIIKIDYHTQCLL